MRVAPHRLAPRQGMADKPCGASARRVQTWRRTVVRRDRVALAVTDRRRQQLLSAPRKHPAPRRPVRNRRLTWGAAGRLAGQYGSVAQESWGWQRRRRRRIVIAPLPFGWRQLPGDDAGGPAEAGRRVAFEEPQRHARIMPILLVKVLLIYSESRFRVRRVARRNGAARRPAHCPLGLCAEEHPVGAMGRADTRR